ncbi:hypothetical protein ACWD7V_44555, partial [Streptomyces sp. NPDC005143]
MVRCCGAAIETLVQQLDGDDAASYDARARLVTLGGDATLAISDGLPALGRFGRLTAIEVFEEGADPGPRRVPGSSRLGVVDRGSGPQEQVNTAPVDH